MKEIEAGYVYTLTAVEEREFGLLLDAGTRRILLPGKEIPAGTAVGDSLKVFIYRDSEDRLIASSRMPYALPGEFACLRVRDVNKTGAFLDWGLDKDLLVPFRLQLDPLIPGQLAVVKILVDEVSGRLIATTKLKSRFNRDMKGLNPGKKVRVMIYNQAERGWQVIVDNEYQGMLYHDEFFTEPRVGDMMDAFIKKIRSDGLLDCTLRRPGFSEVKEKVPDILQLLKEKGGFLPYHDKSSPELIAKVFAMSKKTFKKSIGTLKKKGIIEIEDGGIRLL